MDSLRRLTVRQDAQASSVLQRILTRMPRLRTVIYHGACIGEKRGTPWLITLSTSWEAAEYGDTDASYDDHDFDGDGAVIDWMDGYDGKGHGGEARHLYINFVR